MHMTRKIRKLKNCHWIKIDHVTYKTLDLIGSEWINIVFYWSISFIFVFLSNHHLGQRSKANIHMCKAATEPQRANEDNHYISALMAAGSVH